MIIRAIFRSDANNFLIALVIVLIFHIILISGVKFSVVDENKSEPIIITLIDNSQTPPPQKIDYLAQQNQLDLVTQLSKPELMPRKADINITEKKATNNNEGSEFRTKQKNIVTPKKLVNNKNVSDQYRLVKSNKAPHKTDTIDPSNINMPQLTAESLQQQISQLGSEIRASQFLEEQTKIKAVETIGTHKYIANQYIKDWEAKVERTGNLNFPAFANKKNFSGSLILDVEIKSDGSISAIRINKSSGNFELDEAAKKIVLMSAPFPPLPSEIVKETNVFSITRVWTFSDESGLNTH